MNWLPAKLWILLLASAALAQNGEARPKPHASAVIEGIVLKDPGAEPVKKVILELIAENQAEASNYTAVSEVDGSFRIDGILPGRYRLFAERTGFLEFDNQHSRADGRVLTLAAGQELKDIRIHLQAAAVVRGRITDEDGDPLTNAQVSVLRQKYVSGRAHWDQVGSERSNDLGEYRIAGLPPGTYYVSVNPPPDFKSLIDASGHTDSPNQTDGAAKPAMSYQPTYYPGTADRGQAQPIQLHAGDEFPLNFSLTPYPSLTIQGSVVNVPVQSSAAILLQSRDSNVVLNGAEVHKDGSFIIRDVAPGTYTIAASVENARFPMTARQSLQVYSNIEGVRLAPLPGASVQGRLHFDGKAPVGRFDMTQIYLVLHSTDGDDDGLTAFTVDGFSNLAHVAPDGTFDWKNVPPGNYDITFAGQTESGSSLFLKSVLAGGHNAEGGISVSGSPVVLDLVASGNGGFLEGVVTNAKGEVAENAEVVLVPEMSLRSQTSRFRKATTDQQGRFTLRGIPPGDYSLFAWESVEGDAYYSPEFLKSFEMHATPAHLNAGDRKIINLQLIPADEELQ